MTELSILAEFMQRRGNTLKIAPSVVEEKPRVIHGTFMRCVGDRILPCRLFRRGSIA